MTARDRSVLMVVGALALVAAFWFLVLAPKREQVQQLSDQVVQQQARLDTARASAASAEQARAQYAADYATVARLGKAVPVQDDVPSLVYQLESAATANRIDFRSIKLEAKGGTPAAAAPPVAQVAQAGAQANGQQPAGDQSAANGSSTTGQNASGSTAPATTTPAPATPAAAAGLPPGATVGPASFPIMPFSFGFDGSFFDMESFLHAIDRFTAADGDKITVRGRLLTIDGLSISASRKGFPKVKAAVTATAYLLPADQGLTAGATPTSPVPAAASPSGSTASPTPTAAVTP